MGLMGEQTCGAFGGQQGWQTRTRHWHSVRCTRVPGNPFSSQLNSAFIIELVSVDGLVARTHQTPPVLPSSCPLCPLMEWSGIPKSCLQQFQGGGSACSQCTTPPSGRRKCRNVLPQHCDSVRLLSENAWSYSCCMGAIYFWGGVVEI